MIQTCFFYFHIVKIKTRWCPPYSNCVVWMGKTQNHQIPSADNLLLEVRKIFNCWIWEGKMCLKPVPYFCSLLPCTHIQQSQEQAVTDTRGQTEAGCLNFLRAYSEWKTSKMNYSGSESLLPAVPQILGTCLRLYFREWRKLQIV